jgi:hypothetical protein
MKQEFNGSLAYLHRITIITADAPKAHSEVARNN